MIASQRFAVPVTPLLPVEAEAIAKQLDEVEADQATALLAGLHEGFGRGHAM